MDLITYALAKKMGSLTDAQVESAVETYLEAHPEATTTVEDGAITASKLNSAVYATDAQISAIVSIIEGE